MKTNALTTAQVVGLHRILNTKCECGRLPLAEPIAKRFKVSTSTISRIKAGIIDAGYDEPQRGHLET